MRLNRYLSMIVVIPTIILFGCAGPKQSMNKAVVVDRSLPPVGEKPAEVRLSSGQIQRLLVLLDNADQAYEAKRLTTPTGNNALNYYRQVLSIMPSNQEALLGVERIVERYILWANIALQEHRVDEASIYLNRASQVNNDHPSVLSFRVKLKAYVRPKTESKTRPTSAKPQVVKFDDPYIGLDKSGLRNRNLAMKQYLAQVAGHIKQRNSRVIIEAPSDSAGRWVYQQLNSQHEDYRIRANMKINKNPGIRLLD